METPARVWLYESRIVAFQPLLKYMHENCHKTTDMMFTVTITKRSLILPIIQRTILNEKITIRWIALYDLRTTMVQEQERQSRGVGSFEKLGGQALRGTFRKKRALKNLFFGDPPPTPVVKKISVSVPFWGSKNVSGHTTVFPKYEKIFRIYGIFPRNLNIFPEIT